MMGRAKAKATIHKNYSLSDDKLKAKFLQLKNKWEKKKKLNEISFSEFIDDKVSEMERKLFGKSVTEKKDDFIEDDDFDEEEDDVINPYANLYLPGELALLEKYIEGGVSFDDVLLGCSTNEGIKYFTRYESKLTDKEYWTNLNYVYAMHDYQKLPSELYQALFSSARKDKRYLMKKEEHQFLKSLPDKITIYRGMSEEEFNGNNFGISWTLSKKVATLFANRSLYGERKKKVKQMIIDKSRIVAYFSDRDEEEIIYFESKK